MFSEISVQDQTWSEVFLFAAVIVALLGLVLSMLKVPLEGFFIWALCFLTLALGFAGVLFF